MNPALEELDTLSGSAAKERLEHALEESGGLLKLAPCWVPRAFLLPGRRLKLAADDLYAYGTQRGGIDERWLASTVEAQNPDREADEGLSYCILHKAKVTLREAVDLCQSSIVGQRIWNAYGRWPALCKFFDNSGLIPLHMHQNDEQAALVGAEGKPEAYYFPPQMNAQLNSAPISFFGLAADVSKQQLRDRLAQWNDGDTRMLELSVGHPLELGTGWLVPPGVLHAPGSLCTYEPQWASDVSSMYQNFVDGRFIERSMLVSNIPEDRADDLEYIIEQLDWEANTDPLFRQKHFLRPRAIEGTESEGYRDRCIVYGSINGEERFSAKELTVDPGARCVVRDDGAYGLVCIQGYGAINQMPLSSPTSMRFGRCYDDEYFCSESGARNGVAFENKSATEPLVCLRHFGPR